MGLAYILRHVGRQKEQETGKNKRYKYKIDWLNSGEATVSPIDKLIATVVKVFMFESRKFLNLLTKLI